MREFHKSLLIEKLFELFDEHARHPSDHNTPEELRNQLGRAIDEAGRADEELDTRRVTILLADLRGFADMSDTYSPLAMAEALSRYFARMTDIIQRHGGTVDRFMGDAVMAIFGAPQMRDHDVEAALACAIDMQLAMRGINAENLALDMAPLYMGIGINTGEVVAGRLGSARHSEYTVIGDQVKLASRVEAHSLRGQILLSENTYLLARDYIEVGAVTEVKVKGRQDSVRMIELLATERPARMYAPPRESRNSPRMKIDMPVSFRIFRIKRVLPGTVNGQVIDISHGGLFIASPVELEPFDHLLLTLSLNLLGDAQEEIEAKVLRVNQAGGVYRCRVEFTSMAPQARRVIREFVDGLVEMRR